MLLRVLGPLEVEVDGTLVELPGPRPRALLTALLLARNAVVPSHQLIDVLWGEQPPERAANALHQVVARLRRRLGPDGARIVTHPTGYLLRCDRQSVDAERFEGDYRSVRELRSADPAGSAELLEQALGLWRGSAYAEFADGFARAAAARLDDMRVSAQEDRAALLLQRGFAADAVVAAREVAALQPLRERPVELLMRALHADGRAGDALEVSRRYRELVADELGLDPGPGLRELETRILNDDIDVPAPPPALPAPAAVRGLPWRPGALLGRERELRSLLDCLADQPLVTIIGPGGVGKTRLALEAAHRLTGEGRGVWWADLVGVPPPRVVDALADAAAVTLPPSADPAGSLCDVLGAHRGVLCLDNAEHLLDPLAPVVERLSDTCPDIVVLATSRERLAVGGEHVHLLAPLPLPAGSDRSNPAVRLFLDRCPGLEPDSLSDRDVAVVAGLCRHLDGLPLAIELGATRAATFGLDGLAARLGERLELLAGGRRTAAARHRTLRAVVDWSFDLLTDDEADLFTRLAVFPGAFDLGQVECVCVDDRIPRTAVGPVLARLVEQSLVQAGRGRFWLLETLRTYARERLDPAVRPGLQSRHAQDTATRLAAWVGRLPTAEEPAAVVALAGLGADLHAAWAHTAGHDRALAVQLAGDVGDYAYHRQRRDLLEWGLAVARWGISHPRLPDALASAAAAAWAGGRLPEAERLATRGVAAAGGQRRPAAARALNQLACLAMFDARTDDAAALFGSVAACYRAAGAEVGSLRAEVSVAQTLVYSGQSALARTRLGPLRDAARATGNPSLLSWVHYVLGEALGEDDSPGARAAYAVAVEYATAVDNRLFSMLARSAMVRMAARHSPVDDALGQFERVLDQWEELANDAAQWWVLLHLAVLLDRAGADRQAALLAGAVRSARDQQPSFRRDEHLLTETIERLRGRLGGQATDDALGTGTEMPFATAVAHARQALLAESHRRGVCAPSTPAGRSPGRDLGRSSPHTAPASRS